MDPCGRQGEKSITPSVSAARRASRGDLSHPKFSLRSWSRSALWRGGMRSQEAMAIRLELRTAGAIRRSWDGRRSHKSGPSVDASSVVSVDMFAFCKLKKKNGRRLVLRSAGKSVIEVAAAHF